MYYADGRNLRAHRVAWALAHGTLPDEVMVCHRCDNRKCVNPSHLFLGTGRDNARDMARKGRASTPQHRGVLNPSAKLTEEDAVEIRSRRASGETLTSIARSYEVHRWTISLIIRGETWKHVDSSTRRLAA